jgi:alpha-tubulin suppressor-like RCC1 family protein
MSKFIEKYKVLKDLKEEFLNEIKFLYISEQWGDEKSVFIVTNDDKVFAFGNNGNGVLGFGHFCEVNELTLNEELSHKQIIDFKNGWNHVITRTIDGKVYCWGFNGFGVLGNGKNDYHYYKPELNRYLSDKKIIDICCGFNHTVVLTMGGEVYAWGLNDHGQIGNASNGKNVSQSTPLKLNGFNDEKVVMISSGYNHSMALTESGRVFSWGDNRRRQLGLINDELSNKPSELLLNNEISIKKISCGYEHSLLLSRDGDIYWFGINGCEKHKTPKKLTINSSKFIDIASHYNKDISIALSVNGIYYVWGNCGKEKIKEPKETDFKSFDDIFVEYFQITYKTLDFKPELNIYS